MTRGTIGSVSRDPILKKEGSVLFSIPYDTYRYEIALNNFELDQLLHKGFQSILGNTALRGSDFEIDLTPDLPLYIGAESIQTDGHDSRFQDVLMGVGVTTKSVVHEHRGTLSVIRNAPDGSWKLEDYVTHPPLG